MLIRQILMAVIGLSAGILVAGGLFGFIVELGVIADFADRQLTTQAGHLQMVGRHGFISSFFHEANCRTSSAVCFGKQARHSGISPEARQGCVLPERENADASRSGRRPRPHCSPRDSHFRSPALCTGGQSPQTHGPAVRHPLR